MFQHTAARRRLESKTLLLLPYPCFNTQPPEGGWDGLDLSADNETIVSTHSRPKAAGPVIGVQYSMQEFQHTAARRRLAFPAPLPQACFLFQHTAARRRLAKPCKQLVAHKGFNTQPPEGGWENILGFVNYYDSFNTQPPEGGWKTTDNNHSVS